MVNGRSKTETEVMQKIREIPNSEVLHTTIRIQTAPVISAPLNDTILINNKTAKVAKEYIQLVDELLDGGAAQ